MAFEPGNKKPANSGRKKGTSNKINDRLRNALRRNGCNFEKVLAGAIIEKDVEFIKALSALLPFLAPKFGTIDMKDWDGEDDEESDTPKTRTPAERLAIIRGIKEKDD